MDNLDTVKREGQSHDRYGATVGVPGAVLCKEGGDVIASSEISLGDVEALSALHPGRIRCEIVCSRSADTDKPLKIKPAVRMVGLESTKNWQLTFKPRIYVTDITGTPLALLYDKDEPFQFDPEHLCVTFGQAPSYVDPIAIPSKLIQDGDLQVRYEMEVLMIMANRRITLLHSRQETPNEVPVHKPALPPNGPDFLLVSSDGKVFVTHGPVLKERSPVFAAMLNHATQEREDGRCEVRDLDAVTLEAVLKFIERWDTSGVEQMAEKMLTAADKYGIVELKQLCGIKLKGEVYKENAGRLLALGEHYGLAGLKNVAMECAIKNIFHLIRNGQIEVVKAESEKLWEELLNGSEQHYSDLQSSCSSSSVVPNDVISS